MLSIRGARVRGRRLSLLFLFQENDVTKLYMELAAENKQQLSRLEFAKKIVEKVPAYSLWPGWGTLDWRLKSAQPGIQSLSHAGVRKGRNGSPFEEKASE